MEKEIDSKFRKSALMEFLSQKPKTPNKAKFHGKCGSPRHSRIL
jgi:hypothetical protein